MEFANWILAFAALWLYFTRAKRTPEKNAAFMKTLFVVSVGAIAAIALLQTYLQYAIWQGDPLSQNLLPPYQSIFYFLKYAGTHFWLAPLLSLVVSGAFYGFLVFLKRKNERFFEEGETELGVVAAFLVGWPRIAIFLPAAFLTVIVVSLAKLVFKKGTYTTLGIPFLAGLIVALAYGYAVLQSLGLANIAVIPRVF